MMRAGTPARARRRGETVPSGLLKQPKYLIIVEVLPQTLQFCPLKMCPFRAPLPGCLRIAIILC